MDSFYPQTLICKKEIPPHCASIYLVFDQFSDQQCILDTHYVSLMKVFHMFKKFVAFAIVVQSIYIDVMVFGRACVVIVCCAGDKASM